MNVTLFKQLVMKYFVGFVASFYEFTNEQKKKLTYLHKEMFKLDYSSSMKWGSTRFNNSIVAADIVALDSSLPLKRRPSMGKASGDIPKLGMKVAMRESDFMELRTLQAASNLPEATLAGKLLVDAGVVIPAIDEQLEKMSLEALSTGQTIVPGDEGDSDTGVRVDFGYLAKNKFGSTVRWGSSGFKPISDIRRVISRASDDGTTITTVMMSRRSFNLLQKSDEARMLGQTIALVKPNQIPVPTEESLLKTIKGELGVDIIIVDRSVRIEEAGKHRPVRPWAESSVVFLTSPDVGRLVYTATVEETTNVPGVIYAKPNEYTLVFKYSKTDPLREFTGSQAMIMPVIDGTHEIYLLDNTKEGEISTDETSLEFFADDNLKSDPQVVVVHTDADMVTAKTKDNFIRVKADGKEVFVTVTANNATGAAERQGIVTITDSDGRFLDIIVTQSKDNKPATP